MEKDRLTAFSDGVIAVIIDTKGMMAPLLYSAGIGFAFVRPWIGDVFYAAFGLMWLVPDRRIETHLSAGQPGA